MKVLDFIKKKIFFRSNEEQKDDQNESEVVEEKEDGGWLNIFLHKKDEFVDEEDLDVLEETLISKDVGIETTCKIIEHVEKILSQKKIKVSELNAIVKEIILKMIDVEQGSEEKDKPWVVMMIGVNGVGKTTTIGKLANIYKNDGKKIVIGAADTFRAGAVAQLKLWCENVGVKMIDEGNAPSTVAFNTVKFAQNNDVDVAIIDTAGRLQNKLGLMEELSKIKRVINNLQPKAPHEIFLVLDASTGQNVFSQLEIFVKMINVTGMIITKMDGIAKSGFLIGAIDKFKIPVKFVGTGEKIDDLYYFDPKKFVDLIV